MWYLTQIGIVGVCLWFFGHIVIGPRDFTAGEPGAVVLVSVVTAYAITRGAVFLRDLFIRSWPLGDEQFVNDNLAPSDIRLAGKCAKLLNRVRRGKYLG